MRDLSSKAQTENELDLQLLEKAATGCKSSFSQLFERCYSQVMKFCYRYLQDPSIIEEVANDTMFTVWEKASTFRKDSRVRTWILSIATRKCWEAQRKANKHSAHDELPEQLADNGDTLIATDLHKDIRVAMSSLSPSHQLCIELSYVGGFSNEEIAEIVDCPTNTVKTRLHFARKYMKEFLQQSEIDLKFSDFASDVAARSGQPKSE